jgi:hypothetical protein
MTGPVCQRPLGRGASQEFLPLQRMQMREPTHPGFASSRFGCGCRVSHPLAAFRLPRPSDRFKAGDAHGVFPFEASPSGRSRGASRRPMPSCRCSHSANVAEATCGRLANPASGPCSPPESVTIARGLVARPLDAPLGFCRSRAFRVNVAAGFPATPLSGFVALGSRRVNRPPKVSIRSRGAGAPRS